jgi:hypothetical protein
MANSKKAPGHAGGLVEPVLRRSARYRVEVICGGWSGGSR